MKRILFVASECVPFIKTGGLADVVGTLPKRFDQSQYDVRVVLPNYLCIPDQYRSQMTDITHFTMDLNWRNQYVGIKELKLSGITFYFIDNEYYFGGSAPYHDLYGDVEKFAFFSKAAMAILPIVDFKPDIIHCHDWQASLVPAYLHTIFKDNIFYHNIKTVMTIHNLRFQGICEIQRMMDITGLPPEAFTDDKMESYGCANMLKGGIVFADKITTVSETYAKEIQMPFYGENLDGLLRARNNSLVGIVNGIDYEEYNPNTDDKIYHNYSVDNVQTIKVKNKEALQEELSLPVNADKFVIGVISRLTDQKGFDLVDCVMNEICDSDTQFVALGTGDSKYEEMLRYYESEHKDRVSANIFYSDALSHKIYAGCDAILMPSQFEPCGLCQLMSLRYGTVPIVRETGGLADTVEPYNELDHSGTGFSFANYNAHDMLYTINFAKDIFLHNKEDWNHIMEQGMNMDFSWQKSALLYQELYNSILE